MEHKLPLPSGEPQAVGSAGQGHKAGTPRDVGELECSMQKSPVTLLDPSYAWLYDGGGQATDQEKKAIFLLSLQ